MSPTPNPGREPRNPDAAPDADAASGAAPAAPGHAPVPALRTRHDVPEYHVPDGWQGTGPLPQESAHIRRNAWRLPVVAIAFMVGLWSIMYLWPQGSGAPPGPRDLTAQFRMLHQAFQGPGVTPIAGSRAEMARALKAQVGPYAVVPDLSAAGLVASGARTLNIGGGGMGLIRYRDRGTGPDVLAVFSPRGRVGVPQGSAERRVAGGSVWLQDEPAARIVYTEADGLDWALISGRDGDALVAVAAVLLRGA
jgi:hypothetical protein